MKPSEIHDAAQYARSMTKNLDIALAFIDDGMPSKADYRVMVAINSLHMAAGALGFCVEKITADPARVAAYVDDGREERV